MSLRVLSICVASAMAAFSQTPTGLPPQDPAPETRRDTSNRTGMAPRGSASEYAAHQAAAGVELGAAVIPPDQVKKMFITDLNKGGYIVVELAVFPAEGKAAEVHEREFLLRVGSDATTVRP